MRLHNCNADFDSDQAHPWGAAAYHCYEDKEKHLWISNGEYANQVNYCPFCGYQAKLPSINIDRDVKN